MLFHVSFTKLFKVASLVPICCALAAEPNRLERRATGSLAHFIAAESPIALQGVLSNIGPNGSKAPGASPGVVIASPSTTNPNYFYTWTRDSALTFKLLVDTFIAGDFALQPQIESYISAQAKLQAISNPSGGLSTGGLAEPKFNVDGSAFTGPWGRPQRDGPALRAIAIMAYARWLISNGYTSTVSSILWPIISNDLSYVEQYWNQTGFDLWEEVDGSSFFTVAVQHRALVEGAALAQRIGQTCPGCVSQAPGVLCLLQGFWNGQYLVANTNQNNQRSGKDANTVLGSIHTFDPVAGCDALTFQPCSDKALANHKVLTDSFRSLYAINSGISGGTAVAVGRYPEDAYMGGNPWYINTAAAAELLYSALYQWSRLGSLAITTTSLPFFRDFLPTVSMGTYGSTTSTYLTLTDAIRAYADGYMSLIEKFTPCGGGLAEQFSRFDGAPLSAIDLTWSYASFLTAIARRSGTVPASWGAANANSLPSVCSASSYNGPYATASNTIFPPNQTPATGTTTVRATAPPTSCPTPSSAAVTFNVIETTAYGEKVYIVGSIPELGNWSPSQALLLSASEYTSSDHLWFGTVDLPAGLSFQYKYLKTDSSGAVVWEAGPNRNFVVPSSSKTAVENDTWQ